MNTSISKALMFRLFFTLVPLALPSVSAVAADTVTGTFTSGKEYAVTFKDVYAFRVETEYNTLTVVYLSDSPLNKKAITAAIKKERNMNVMKNFVGNRVSYAKLEIDENGNLKDFYVFTDGLNYSGERGKSEIKINTAKRVEGRYMFNENGTKPVNVDVRFATDVTDVGLVVKK